MLTLDKVFDASNVLKEVIRPTACIHAPKVNPDCDVYLKTENLQVTGSFKVRGAYYKISQLSDEEKSHGVIACSAGNHAQGVALAATKNGIKSIICLPDGAPISKVEATKGYGAEVFMMMLITKLSNFKKKRDIHLFTRSMTRMLSQVRELSVWRY